MGSTEVLSAYIKKLGHPLKEIRERALKLLAAKLQLGWELHDELSGTRQLFEALLAWFHVQRPSLQREALELLLMVLKTKSGTYIVKEFGIEELISQLNNLKIKITSEALEVHDDVLETLRFLNTLQSQDNLTVPRLNIPSASSSDCEEGSCKEYDHLGPHFQSSNQSSVSNEEIEVNRYNISRSSEGIKILLFPWAVMSQADSKTILLIEDALKLLKSTRRCCRFIRDVFLRDFPAEIFLNRPAILKNLLNIIETDNSGKLSEPLQVLQCIIQALRKRLRQLSSLDLIHETNKIPHQNQKDCDDRLTTELEEIVSDAGLASNFRVNDDGLDALRQLPAPICALDGLQAILSVMARSVVLQEPNVDTEVLDMNELNLCISLVESQLGLLLDCIDESFWSMDHSTKTYRDIAHKSVMVMRQLGDLLDKYRTSFLEKTSRTHHLVSWLRLVGCGERVLHWAFDSALSPAVLLTALQTAQLDPALGMFYTQVSQLLVTHLQGSRTSTNKEFKTKYKELTKLFAAMEAAAAFIKNKDSCRSYKSVLTIIKNSLPVLELHVNDSYLTEICDIILRKAKEWDYNDKDWSDVRTIALSLMAHNLEWVQSRFYTMMADMVNMVFVDENEDQGDNEKCLALFCDVGVLTEICCHGLNSKYKEVENSASEIMLYLLRGRMVLSEACWWRLLASLLPTLPLLHVYAAHDTTLGQAICKSLESDIAECMGVSRAEVLFGLVRLLFVRCPTVQMDATHSLCHLLDDPKYLPPQESLRADVLISALKRVEQQDFNVNYSKSPVKSPQTSSLVQVLDVLKQDLTLDDEGHGLISACLGREPTLEPSLRRATLQQLSVLMLQHEQHDSFLQFDGINIVVAILRMSLLVDDYLAFPECANSCVSVLNSICFGSRHILAKIHDLPALLLRVILIFPSNDSTVQMASQVLAVVAWAGFTLQELDSDRKRALALPASVVLRTQLPFPSGQYWTTSPNAHHSSVEWLQTSEEWRASIRVRWSCMFSALRFPVAPPLAAPPGPVALRMTPHDVTRLQAACPLYGTTKGLLALQNATSHRQVNDALALLESYTYLLPKSSVKTHDYASLPWHTTLSRFLTAPPASPRDIVLLTSLLKFVIAYMDNIPTDGGTMTWIKTSFLASESSMISLLSREELYPQQSTQDNIEITQLHTHIVKVLVRCVFLMEDRCDGKEGLLKILLACLERVDLKNFHVLGYLNELLGCIRYLVNSLDVSLSEDTILECVSLMTRTLSGCAAGGGRKGQGCRLDAMLTLLALLRSLHELQIPVQRWSDAWRCSEDVSLVLVSCARSPRPELRASALAVLAVLANYTHMLHHLLDAVPAESLAQYAADIFAEKSEANVVRASAATILTALASRPSSHSDAHEHDMLVQLKDNHFMEHCLEILVAFCNNENEYKNYIEPNVPLSLIERRSELEVRAKKHISLHISPSYPLVNKPPPTPGLVVALADVVYNVGGFTTFPVKAWNDQGFFRLLFRCASWSNGATCDNITVRTAACRALARLSDGHKCIRTTLANTKDCLHNLLATLKPLSEEKCEASHLYAQAQALLLLSTLLPERAASNSVLTDLKECSQSFFHLLLQSLEIDESDLQDAGLYCLTQLTQSIAKKKHVDKTQDDSWIQFLDNLKSPYYLENTPRISDIFRAGDNNDDANCQPEYLNEELCKDLMLLYQKYAIDKKKFQASQDGNWSQVCSSLSSLFSVSSKAREYAVHREFSKTLLLTLQGVRDHLSMHNKPADLIRNANNNPVLLTLYWLLTTISSLMTSCPRAKESFASDSIAVSLLRVWPWCMMTEPLRVAVVELMLIFTNESPQAWSAMSTCVGGRSLISEISSLIVREAALLSRPRPAPLLPAGLHALRHCVSHHHCRALLLKSDVLACIHKIRVAERCRLGKTSLLAWAQLAEALSRYSDGAASLLDLRAVLTAPGVRSLLMPAIAHAAHYHRSLFLQTPELLELLSGSLLAGDTAEMVSAARAIWALAANNHRAKLALRSAGVTAAVYTTMERLQRSHRDARADRTLQLLTYTHTVLHTS